MNRKRFFACLLMALIILASACTTTPPQTAGTTAGQTGTPPESASTAAGSTTGESGDNPATSAATADTGDSENSVPGDTTASSESAGNPATSDVTGISGDTPVPDPSQPTDATGTSDDTPVPDPSQPTDATGTSGDTPVPDPSQPTDATGGVDPTSLAPSDSSDSSNSEPAAITDPAGVPTEPEAAPTPRYISQGIAGKRIEPFFGRFGNASYYYRYAVESKTREGIAKVTYTVALQDNHYAMRSDADGISTTLVIDQENKAHLIKDEPKQIEEMTEDDLISYGYSKNLLRALAMSAKELRLTAEGKTEDGGKTYGYEEYTIDFNTYTRYLFDETGNLSGYVSTKRDDPVYELKTQVLELQDTPPADIFTVPQDRPVVTAPQESDTE